MARVPHDPAGDTDRLRALEDETARLKEAVSAHAVVDRAIGMVVALGG
ncbi:hypothetical protein [Streptomyces cinereospinus]|uniref:Small hydrophilic protein n=1 Tax=Streptomyces cinereospinus TaxID=285561 RepID=A0ABV5N380_9ACTN